MRLLKKMVCPVRKLLSAIATRVKSRKHGASILKLHDDIQTCGYQDIQVMWEMIRSESELNSQSSKQKQKSFWRFFIWQNQDRAHTSP
ncbi:hypothetical protein AgCh_031700 [Apium graveolens]